MTCTCTEECLQKKQVIKDRTFKRDRQYVYMDVEVSEEFPEGRNYICYVDSFGFRGVIRGECDECYQAWKKKYNSQALGPDD